MKGENVLKFIDKNIAINKSIGMVGGIDLMALKNELVEIIEKADKWDEKETPKFATYTPAFQSYYSAGDECEILCPKCKCSLDEYDWENKPNIKYCPECGQRIHSIDEQEEIFRKSKTEYPNGIILDWGE